MDISNNIQGIGSGLNQDAVDNGLSLQQATEKPSAQKTFTAQFKTAAQTPETEPSDLDQAVVSDRIFTEELSQTQTNFKTVQQNTLTNQVNQNKAIPYVEGEVISSIIQPDGGIKKLDKQSQNVKAALLEELTASEDGIITVEAASTIQAQLNTKTLKKIVLGSDKTDELEIEVISTLKTDDVQDTEDSSPPGNTDNIAQQQKLFSLNLRSSLKFLRDQKCFAQKFVPEIVSYDEDTGCVNGEETLKMLGWQDVQSVRETFYPTLSNNQLNTISNTQNILKQASEDGLNVYNGLHPVFSKINRVIAVEKLTGELTIINSLTDLQKLQLEDNVIRTHQTSL